MQLGKFAEAVGDFDRAIQVDRGESGPALHLPRALALARIGKHAEAAAEAGPLRQEAQGVGPVLYELAQTFGHCAAAAAADAGLSAADRARLSGEYASSALVLLREAKDAGYFTAETIAALKTEPAFRSISDRREYRALLDSLE
jgi:hypothetical protein